MAKTWKEISESFEFNRAALAKQRLQNIRHSGRRVRGASVANLLRTAGIKEEEMDETDLDQIDEVLSKDATASDWIHDFVHSTNPKFEGKSKKERIQMALGAYYGKQRNESFEDEHGIGGTPKKGTDVADKSWLKTAGKKPGPLHNVGKGLKAFMTGKKEPMESVQLSPSEKLFEALDQYGIELTEELVDQILEAAKKYAGLEKEDKPNLPTAMVKTSKTAVEGETVEGWKTKKPVKEQYDEEGNVIYSKVSYKDFAEQLLEYTPGPGGVTRVQGRGYGNAKGAKYGNTDYDNETLEKSDDEETTQQKRGRGRPAGSKSGARGPRIK